MTLDNSTPPDLRSIELNTLALDILQNAAISATSTVVQVSLSSLSFGEEPQACQILNHCSEKTTGVLTIVVIAAIYFLMSERTFVSNKTTLTPYDSSRGSVAQTNGRILLLCTTLLYGSTVTYMAALIWAWSEGDRLISKAVGGLFSSFYDGRDDMAIYKKALHKQSWMMTITLAVNVSPPAMTSVPQYSNADLVSLPQLVTGDAIVWWRACVIWKHKLVNWIGVLLLTCTASMSRSSVLGPLPRLIPPMFVEPLGWPWRGVLTQLGLRSCSKAIYRHG